MNTVTRGGPNLNVFIIPFCDNSKLLEKLGLLIY
jgi:hypothetical protein